MPHNQRLKHERVQRGWSQARVAEQIGTDAVNVSRWERGFSSPTPYYREKLCLLFNKSAQELGFLNMNIEDEREREPEREPFVQQVLLPIQIEQHQAQKEQDSVSTSASASIPLGSRILASLSYVLFWITGLLLFLFNRSNRFVLFHSLQSLLIFGSATVFYIAFACVMAYVPFIPVHVFALIFAVLVTMIAVISWIVGIVKALTGSYYKLPFVGSYSEQIAATLFQQRES